MSRDSTPIPLASLALAVAIVAAPFLYLHFTGSGVLFLICAPLGLLLSGVAIFTGLHSRPRAVPVAVVATVVAGFAVWTIVGLTLFRLTCNGIIDAGSC